MIHFVKLITGVRTESRILEKVPIFAQHFTRAGKSLENRGQVKMVRVLNFFSKLRASSPI